MSGSGAPGGGGGGNIGQDLCENVVPVNLQDGIPQVFTGDNSGATPAGDFMPGTEGFEGVPVIWHAFTIEECMTVKFDYCEQDPVWEQTWGFLWTSCPAELPNIQPNFNLVECGNGNVTYEHTALGPGTYFIGVPLAGTSVGEYSINVLATACPLVAENDHCADVEPVILNAGVPLEFSGDNTAATTANDWVDGSDLTGAPVVWHAFTTNQCTNITLDYCGLDPMWGNTLGTLFTTCPGDEDVSVGAVWFNTSDCPDGNVTYGFDAVPAGTYYVPVLLFPDGDAIGPYTISLNAALCGPPENDQCSSVDALPLPVGESLTFAGNNSTATSTGDWVVGSDHDGSPVAWHAFTLQDCSDVYVSYCGQDPMWEDTFGLLFTTCPGDEAILFEVPLECADGNVIWYFDELEAGTYYLPILNNAGANSSGPYTIEVTAALCGSLALQEQEELPWTVYPNPGNGQFTLHNGGAAGLTHVELLDLSGRLLKVFDMRVAPYASGTLDLSGASAGTYLLRITTTVGDRHEQRLMIR